MRKTLGTIAAVVTAMSLIGVAWAADDVGVDGSLQGEAAVSSSITTTDDSSPVTTEDGSTSTSNDDSGSTDTSLADTTSGTADDDDNDSTTSTSLDDVTVEVLGNGLRLVEVDAPGWTIEIEKAESDRIEIEFNRGDDEAEFEAELESHGGLSIEIDQD